MSAFLNYHGARVFSAGSPCTRSFASKTEIVKQGHAVGFRPNTHLAGVRKAGVVGFDRLRPVKGNSEMTPAKIHPQSVPHTGGDFGVRVFERHALAANGVEDGHVVFERVAARYVVIVGVLAAPDNAAGLVFFTRDGLEFHLHKAVLELRVVFDADGKRRLARLL
jgi:hypothetical protein